MDNQIEAKLKETVAALKGPIILGQGEELGMSHYVQRAERAIWELLGAVNLIAQQVDRIESERAKETATMGRVIESLSRKWQTEEKALVELLGGKIDRIAERQEKIDDEIESIIARHLSGLYAQLETRLTYIEQRQLAEQFARPEMYDRINARLAVLESGLKDEDAPEGI